MAKKIMKGFIDASTLLGVAISFFSFAFGIFKGGWKYFFIIIGIYFLVLASIMFKNWYKKYWDILKIGKKK